MVKAVALIKRKPRVSRQDFLTHYEEVHAPLILKCFPTLKRYVRNHIVVPPAGKDPPFDCITELWYEDMKGYMATIDFWRSAAGRVIRDDEDSFLDRKSMVFVLVDERVSV
ncbi:MAG: EthD domain-containing protein [Chloroflexi bacterium]|nr:EthD domain-containing protein [Chloroflexota bacterium]